MTATVPVGGSAADTRTGRRARKKQQTREMISDVATALFAARGFEQATIADVARAADVAKMTVTNYFPLKEDLVFDRHEMITALLSGAVVGRPAGVSVLDALRREYADALGRRDPILGFMGREFAEMVTASPALRSRERVLFAEQEAALADVITAAFATSPADVRPRIASAELAAVFRILYYEARRRLLAGEATVDTIRALRRAARVSFDLVEHGLPKELTTA